MCKNKKEYIERITNSMMVSVKISHREELKIILNNLIGKRNSSSCRVVKEFDAILKAYFLTDEEFEKYVIHKEKIT